MKVEIVKNFLVYQWYLQSIHIALKSRKMITIKMRLTKEAREKNVELHFQNNGSVVSVQRNYRRIFCDEKVLRRSA